MPQRSPSADLNRAAAGLDAAPDAALLLDCGLLRGCAERDAGRGLAQPLALRLIHDKGEVS